MPMFCHTCGTENRDGAKFCKGCGIALAAVASADSRTYAAKPNCAACGHLNDPSARFCAKCGNLLPPPANESAPPPLAASPGSVVAARELAGSAVPSRSGTVAAEPPARPKRVGLWLALGSLVLAAGVVGAWWVTGRSTPAPASTDVARKLAESASAPPSKPVAAPVPAAPPDIAVREVAEQRAREQAEREAIAKVEQQRKEIERLTAERDAARRHAEEERAHAQRQQEAPPAAPPVAQQPRTPAPVAGPVRALTVKERCARSGNVFTRGLCEVNECIKPKNWEDPFCKQQQREAAERNRSEP